MKSKLIIILLISNAAVFPAHSQSNIWKKCCSDVSACCQGDQCDCSNFKCAMTMDLENDRRFGRQEGPFVLLKCKDQQDNTK